LPPLVLNISDGGDCPESDAPVVIGEVIGDVPKGGVLAVDKIGVLADTGVGVVVVVVDDVEIRVGITVEVVFVL
jgi:hypothetical protein